MDYVIMTDTSANLPDEIIQKYDLRVLPFFFCPPEHPEGIPCPGSAAFDGTAYYNAIRRGSVVTTSQINLKQFLDEMDPILEGGQDILFIGMSSGVSGSFNSARLAAQQLSAEYPARRIRTVDTLSASLGEGLLVLEAARLREEGRSPDEVADYLEEAKLRMCQIFTVDDLHCLKRGGRLSGGAALLGSALGLKPLLCASNEGKIVSCGKVRGRKAALQALAEMYDELAVEPEGQCIGIAHCDCYPDVQTLIGLLDRNHPSREILTVMCEPVTGAHLGPGTIAIFFWSHNKCRR